MYHKTFIVLDYYSVIYSPCQINRKPNCAFKAMSTEGFALSVSKHIDCIGENKSTSSTAVINSHSLTHRKLVPQKGKVRKTIISNEEQLLSHSDDTVKNQMTGKCWDPHRDDIISLCIDSVTHYRKSGSVFREGWVLERMTSLVEKSENQRVGHGECVL